MNNGYSTIWTDGLWRNNPAFTQLLGLCPLLAVTSSVINGLGLGLATMLTLVATNVTVSVIRRWVPSEIRIPVFVMVIAAVVTVIELLMAAYRYDLYKVLGIFIPLIVTNCTIIGRAEAFASKNSVDRSLMDGLAMGAGFTIALVALGAMREVIGQGTLFAQAELMFGEAGRGMTLHLIEDYRGFLLAILPPGAFMGLGLLIAIKNVIDRRMKAPRAVAITDPEPATGSTADPATT
ncbi:MAG: electron transport complex subunit E [Gammaproteobacteria bacterium]|nr:electron transport complex subunit E [Gammaproteobacteria bacterium]